MKPELTPAQINALHAKLRSMGKALDSIMELLGMDQPQKKSPRQPPHDPDPGKGSKL